MIRLGLECSYDADRAAKLISIGKRLTSGGLLRFRIPHSRGLGRAAARVAETQGAFQRLDIFDRSRVNPFVNFSFSPRADLRAQHAVGNCEAFVIA
jgi:hypothetical protein